ncbi:hypothetical protein GPROT2_01506 [Gammaproteobacteria bacterium]|nr:hypothetical protein GPROT2_01506 [Gammaproteobacteria bacterium]
MVGILPGFGQGLWQSRRRPAGALLLILAGALPAMGPVGCAALAGAATTRFADGLSQAILNQDDPELVREGTPAYLILLDALVRSEPDNPRYLEAAAQLYAAYGVAFVHEEQRSASLTMRAREYGARAICAADRQACQLDEMTYDAYAAAVDRLRPGDAGALYSYCVGSLAFIRAHSGDWAAIAGLPKVEHALQRLLDMPGAPNPAGINMYLGILNTLRPEALGGRPEVGRAYFERAIEISGGRDLSAKVEFARSYARMVYDRDLHDRLLREVLDASPRQEGLTLFNTLAQAQARDLLASADDYF